jgi:hypothetical protein
MKQIFFISVLSIVVAGCSQKTEYKPEEDLRAKEMFQGVWVSESNEPVLLAKGDSILYPDSSSQPVRFWINKDSIFLKGAHVTRYMITKQMPHVFLFTNQTGDEVKLLKSDDNSLKKIFFQNRPYAINTFRIEDKDTTIFTTAGYFDCNIHMETTSDRVLKSDYNDWGIEVDNMYLDNLARLTVVTGGQKFYQHEFRKQEFSQFIPKELLARAILQDFQFDHCDDNAMYFSISIGIPDASTGYVIQVRLSNKGTVTKKLI